MSKTIKIACVALVTAALTGCMFRDVKKQVAIIESYCTFEGTVSNARRQQHRTIVLLVRLDEAATAGRPWQLVDYFVLDKSGPWEFFSTAGNYGLVAFDDLNGDLAYQQGEPVVTTDPRRLYSCKAGNRFESVNLQVPATPQHHLEENFSIAEMMVRIGAIENLATGGMVTAVGEVISLDDSRFAEEDAVSSLWRPHDAIFKLHPGVYFVEPYDPAKIPVLFVHGINDSPKTFKYLIEHMDRKRFQPWLYSYPSGVHLSGIADHLTQTMAKLRARHEFNQHAVLAHSMGGLVSRGYIVRNAESGRGGKLPLFVSISTPWEGVAAAASGIKHAPEVVRVWHDMAPHSEYIESLYAQPLPAGTDHHLLFTFKRKSMSFGESDDETVAVSSQMSPRAQKEAVRLYGFDDTHIGVLSDAEVSKLVNQLVAKYYP